MDYTDVDYKELIKNLREEAVHQRVVFGTHGVSCQLEGAADAIETLLAERDAAVEELSRRPHHSTCKYGENCDYISAITGFPDCYSCDEWEWHGPKKGDTHGDLPQV